MTLLGHIAEFNVISSMRRVLEIAIYFFESSLNFKSIETEVARLLVAKKVDFGHSLTQCLELPQKRQSLLSR